DDTDEAAGHIDRGRIDKGLEPGELDLPKTHVCCVGKGLFGPCVGRPRRVARGAHRVGKSRSYNNSAVLFAAASRAHATAAAIMATRPTKSLETFANPAPERDYLVHIEIPEFTCLCPMTGQPDFATLVLDYVPDRRNVELKALKLYIWSYRDEGAFHEAVTNRILDDLVAATRPRFMRLVARFYVRGGIFTTVVVQHVKAGWKIAGPPELHAHLA